MNKINKEKIINYSNSATKGAAIGGAVGAVVSTGFGIQNFLTNAKFSKVIKESPPDVFEKIAKKGIVTFNEKDAQKAAKLLKEGLKLDEAKKHIIKLHKKYSKSAYKDLPKIFACCALLGACVGAIVQYFKNKTKEN